MNKHLKLTAPVISMAAAMGLAVSAGTAAAGTVTSKGEDIIIDTTGGFSAETADKKFTFKLGGRFMWDYDMYDGAFTGTGLPANELGDRVDSNNLRRSRLELKGTAYTDWEYVFAINFGQSGGSSINDLGVAYTGFKGHKVFLGRGKEPFGLEELTSSKWISTIERGMFWDSTRSDAQSNFGVRYDGYYYDLVNLQLGWFDQGFNSTNGSSTYAKTIRVTAAPIAESGQVVHFGIAYRDAPSAEAGSQRLINASPGISNIGKNNGGTNTNLLRQGASGFASDESQLGLEALGIYGPASVQFEYFMRDVEVSNAPTGQSDQSVDSWYLLGTYTLTGESRGYKAKGAYADKISPKGRYGAIELVARYDHIEADTGGVDVIGATAAVEDDPSVDAITLGANWYVNKNVKFALNYTDTSSDNLVGPATATSSGDEDGSAVVFRAQYAF